MAGRMTLADALALAAKKFDAGELAAATDICKQVLQAAPASSGAWNLLGIAAHVSGRFAEAEDALRKALALVPQAPTYCCNLGLLLTDLGRYEDAIAILLQATELAPEMAPAHNNLGLAFLHHGLADAAAASFNRALALEPGDAKASLNLGFAYARQGKISEADAAYRRVLGTRKNDVARVRLATLLPVIPQSLDEIASCRRNMSAAVEALGNAPLTLDDPVRDGNTAFYLAYHGENDKPLQVALARMYARACPSLEFRARHCRGWRLPDRPLRVGFISAFMRRHSIGHVTRGLIAKLDREHFHTYALFIPPLVKDDVSKFIGEHAQHALMLPPGLDAARRAIAALELDVLFYQDIGMEPVSYFLAHARLAPVQCVSFGHPDTTGIPNVDYFVSNDLFEPPGAAAHYSETLFQLNNLGTLAYYYRPDLAPAPKTRAEFGLPAARIYYCPQTPYKFHPDFDLILGGILRADPEARLVLPETDYPHWGALLRQRMERTMGDVIKRVLTVPRQRGTNFLSLLGAADVLLDTTHFNGMNTSLQGFAAGTPIVTLPGAFQRGRHTAGMYRRMGITECIARSAQDYVEIAVRLARERDFGAAVREKIALRREVLFEDENAVREFERFFREAAAAMST